jgi:hypothetical protein
MLNIVYEDILFTHPFFLKHQSITLYNMLLVGMEKRARSRGLTPKARFLISTAPLKMDGIYRPALFFP